MFQSILPFIAEKLRKLEKTVKTSDWSLVVTVLCSGPAVQNLALVSCGTWPSGCLLSHALLRLLTASSRATALHLKRDCLTQKVGALRSEGAAFATL